ncbi:Ig-like domain-containing protein [Saccharospirillum salsuginis]|uniref:SbsA Ig-like domain-containing protein n=1 Tax=Saccharospirillum salsuginis TaxID=418750 RepID=A0A918KQX5_9GAMM|nr:Ig-like domain-containing protein [Saccharospirillum salsuginis]GGX72369.1 hypothetical protein GCM10007392_44770 [Saccharospirillum salsuginis]
MKMTSPGAATLAITGLLLAGCSGSGDSDDTGDQNQQDNDTQPIGSVTPAEGATGVDRGASVEITFTDDVYAQSVGPVSLTLASDTLVAGQVDFDAGNNRLSFQPDQSLGKLVDYTATVSTTVTDLDGEPLLDAAHTWSFTTEDGAWQAVKTIDDPNEGASSSASVAVNASGEAIAAWHQDTATDYSIYTARFDPELGEWQDAILAETDSGNAESTSVAINDDGDIVVAWRQWGTSNYDIRANYYDSATGTWSGDEILDGGSMQVSGAQVAIDADGKAVVVWKQGGLLYNVYEPGTGWGSVDAVVDGASIQTPALTVDADGRFSAVWTQFNYSDSRYDLYASRWVDDSGWQSPIPVEELDDGDATKPSLTVDASGNLLAVWQQNDGTVDNIRASRFDVEAGSWGSPILLEQEDQHNAQEPHVHINEAGRAIAVWEQFDGSRTAIQSARFETGTGWQTPIEVDPDGSDSASDPIIALDADGNAWAAWVQSISGGDALMASRMAAGADWETPVEIDNQTWGVSFPTIGVSSGQGDAVLVWRQSDTKARWFR